MSALDQLKLVEDCQQRMKRAGIRFAIVAAFPDGGGAFLCGGNSFAEDENGADMPALMRGYADMLAEDGLGAVNGEARA